MRIGSTPITDIKVGSTQITKVIRNGITYWARTPQYYVSNAGNDANTGLSLTQAWRTIAKVNATNFVAGDNVTFKRGDTWREQLTPKSGSSLGYVTYGTYGTGAKPLFLGSVQANSTGDWIDQGGNIWQNSNAAFTVDVANIVFNDGESFGVKLMTATPTFNSQGQFWYDYVNNRIRLFSVGNPATFYTNVECVLKGDAIGHNGGPADYVTFQNLDFRYWGSCVDQEGGNFRNYYDLTIRYIGGADIDDNYVTRFGNGVQIWEDHHDINIRRCWIDNVYDAGISPQGQTGVEVNNIYIRDNIISNCEYSYEIFWHNAATSSHDIYFENNDCINAGGGWSHYQRPDGVAGCHVRIGNILSTCSNISIQNNRFYDATERTIYYHNATQLAKVILNNNQYYQPDGKSFAYNTDLATNYNSLAAWKAASLQEAGATEIGENSAWIALYGSLSFNFVWVTDVHIGDAKWNAGEAAALVTHINTINPAFVLSSGDQILTTGDQTETDTYNGIMANLTMPIYNLRGNHDGGQFTQHFIIDHQGIRIIAYYASYEALIDTTEPIDPYYNTGLVSAGELTWIETQMQNAGGRQIILVGHYPLSPNFWGYTQPGYGAEGLIALCNTYNIPILLSGHEHDNDATAFVGNGTMNVDSYATVDKKFHVCRVSHNNIRITPYNALSPFAAITPVINKQFASTALRNGLNAFWSLDELSVPYIYSPLGSNTVLRGTQSGTLTFGVPGKIGTAIASSGTPNFIAFSDTDLALFTPVKLTLSIWFKTTTAENGLMQVSNGGNNYGYNMSVSGTHLRCKVYGVTAGVKARTGTTVVNTGNWVHGVMTVDGINLKVYVNGVQDGADLAFAEDIAYLTPQHFMFRSDGVYGAGILDEVSIWNRALSQSEITELYTKGNNGISYPW